MSSVRISVQDFERLKRELHACRSARVRVGILANKAERQEYDKPLYTAGWKKDTINNPSLGLIHEFGSKTQNVPARSFLRMPLMTRLPKRLEKIGRDFWRSMILKLGVKTALKALGIEGENAVQEAFATKGFGAWPPWSRRYARWRLKLDTLRRAAKAKGPMIEGSLLILSAQLRRSITSRVEAGNARP